VRRLEVVAVSGHEARVLPAEGVLLARVGGEGAHAARERLARVSVTRSGKALEGFVQPVEPSITESVPEGVTIAEPKPWAAGDERTLRLQEELRRAQRDLGLAKARVTELEVAAAEAARHRAEQAGTLLSTRQLYAEAKARAEALEAKLLEKTAEAAASREHARIKSAGDAITRKQYEAAVVEKIKAEETLAHRSKRLAEAEAKIKDMDAKLRTAEGLGSPESRQREAKLREQIADLSARLTQAEGELKDVRLREQRLSGDKTTLQRIAQEHEAQVVVLRGRVRDLMASRWRKLGQRLHLAMTMPWEENGNGKPH
jgi:chromosome segregation ATPase